MKKHKHQFKVGRSKTVAVCTCGKFKFVNVKPSEIITEVKS